MSMDVQSIYSTVCRWHYTFHTGKIQSENRDVQCTMQSQLTVLYTGKWPLVQDVNVCIIALLHVNYILDYNSHFISEHQIEHKANNSKHNAHDWEYSVGDEELHCHSLMLMTSRSASCVYDTPEHVSQVYVLIFEPPGSVCHSCWDQHSPQQMTEYYK